MWPTLRHCSQEVPALPHSGPGDSLPERWIPASGLLSGLSLQPGQAVSGMAVDSRL